MGNVSTIHLNKLTKCCHYSIGAKLTPMVLRNFHTWKAPSSNIKPTHTRVQSPEQADHTMSYLVPRGTKVCPLV